MRPDDLNQSALFNPTLLRFVSSLHITWQHVGWPAAPPTDAEIIRTDTRNIDRSGKNHRRTVERIVRTFVV